MSQNSDKEQCTESKLGWVHQVHTLTQPTCTSRAYCSRPAVSRSCPGPVPCRIVACGRSCRRPGQPCRRPGQPCRRPGHPCHRPGQPCRRLYRDTPSTKAMCARRVTRCCACRSAPAPCCRALSAVSQPLAALYRDTRSPPSQP